MTRTVDHTHRIGRCRQCPTTPAFAWLASTGLRLDDVRCPRCGSHLDKTSREVRAIRRLTDDEVTAQRATAIVRAARRTADQRMMSVRWSFDAARAVVDGTSPERADFNAESFAKAVPEADRDLARLVKADRRARVSA